MKYMIQMIDSDHALIGNNKLKLQKAYAIAVKAEYKAYTEACELTQSPKEVSLEEMLQCEVEAYDGEMLNTYKFSIQIVN